MPPLDGGPHCQLLLGDKGKNGFLTLPFPALNLSSSGSYTLCQLVVSLGLQLVEGLHLPLGKGWQGRHLGQLVLGAFLPHQALLVGWGSSDWRRVALLLSV